MCNYDQCLIIQKKLIFTILLRNPTFYKNPNNVNYVNLIITTFTEYQKQVRNVKSEKPQQNVNSYTS